MTQTRRDFLTLSLQTALLALGVQAGFPLSAPAARTEDFTAPLPIPGRSGLFGLLPVRSRVTLKATSVPGLLPATSAPMLAYAATDSGRQFFNPVLVLDKGQRFEADLENGLQEPTIIHWHGVDTPWRQAGHPAYAIGPEERYVYSFDITNRAGTYWYHPHPHMLTAKQAYLGLASFFIVRDAEELAFARDMDLVLGETDIPLVIQDKKFDASGLLEYAPSQDELAMGYLGDRILVNGADKPTLDVGTRGYRFRLLNGSNARLYQLAFLTEGRRLPLHIIGNDGGMLPAPQQVETVFLAPGERVDVVLDLSGLEPGTAVFLQNMPFDPMHNEMSGMHAMESMPGMQHMVGMDMGTHSGGHAAQGHAAMEHGGLAEGASFSLLRLRVRERVAYGRRLPQTLSAVPALPAEKGAARSFDLAMGHMGGWTINGLTFAMDEAPVVVPQRGRETWTVTNAVASMPHPMHLHGYFFRVRSRKNSPEQVRRQAADASGRIPTDFGFKDTVLVWPGESVALDVDFGTPDYPGEQLFLFHCHNLEHEDQGMMLNVKVE